MTEDSESLEQLIAVLKILEQWSNLTASVDSRTVKLIAAELTYLAWTIAWFGVRGYLEAKEPIK